MKNIYLDYAATTPLDERVYKSMRSYFLDNFGNPSSIHFFGQMADAANEKAHENIAESLSAFSDEIVITGGGTESDNLAIRGACLIRKSKKGAYHILISPVEHHAVLKTAEQMAEYFGFEMELMPVDKFGQVNPSDVAARIRSNTALVSIIYANNEIGTINPISDIGRVCRENEVLFHTDAVQAAAHMKINVEKEKIDLLSIGAHKFYGPKGVGALYVRRGLEILPVNTGGGQESGLRAGTQNVPYIVGLAEAFRYTQLEMGDRRNKLSKMRDIIIDSVTQNIQDSHLTGHPIERLPNHASFVFKGVDGNHLLMILDANGFACSSGSACKSGNPKPSSVLLNLGYSSDLALGSLRVTLGKDTTQEEVDKFVKFLPEAVYSTRKYGLV